MAWAWSFATEPTAAAVHACTQCGGPIGRGDNYKREAIPPWGYEDLGEDGAPVRYSIGEWLIIKRCYECTPQLGSVYT